MTTQLDRPNQVITQAPGVLWDPEPVHKVSAPEDPWQVVMLGQSIASTAIQEVGAQLVQRLWTMSKAAIMLPLHLLGQAKMAPGKIVPVVRKLKEPVVREVTVKPGRELGATLVVRYIAVNTVHQGMAADVVSMHRKVLEAAIMDLLHRLYQVIIPKLVVLWNPKLVVIVVYKVSAPVGPRFPAVMLGQ
jgi:hypothetical protein